MIAICSSDVTPASVVAGVVPCCWLYALAGAVGVVPLLYVGMLRFEITDTCARTGSRPFQLGGIVAGSGPYAPGRLSVSLPQTVPQNAVTNRFGGVAWANARRGSIASRNGSAISALPAPRNNVRRESGFFMIILPSGRRWRAR